MTSPGALDGVTVVTTIRYAGAHWDRLAEALAGARILHFESGDDPRLHEALADAEVAILAADPDERLLRAPRLRWIHVDHAGLNKAAKPTP